jgi:6,7-dimethyl-8-ribityllumazine synthase
MTSSDATALDAAAVARVEKRVQRVQPLVVAADARVGFVCAAFNGGVTTRLLGGALDALDRHGPGAATATVVWVPGAFELPLAAQALATSGTVDAVVALGAVIRGDTPHFDFVADGCVQGLVRVGLDRGQPVVFGVLTTDTVDQALERCRPDETNKGFEAAVTALQMVTVCRALGSAPAAAGVRER